MTMINPRDSACGRCDEAPFCARCKEWALDYLAAAILQGRPDAGELACAWRDDPIGVALGIAGWDIWNVRRVGLDLLRTSLRASPSPAARKRRRPRRPFTPGQGRDRRGALCGHCGGAGCEPFCTEDSCQCGTGRADAERS